MESCEFSSQMDLFSERVPLTVAHHVLDTFDGDFWIPQYMESLHDDDDARIHLTAAWTGELWTAGYLVALWPKLLLEIMPGRVCRRHGYLYAPDTVIEAQTLDVVLSSAVRHANLTLASMAPWTTADTSLQRRMTDLLSARGLLSLATPAVPAVCHLQRATGSMTLQKSHHNLQETDMKSTPTKAQPQGGNQQAGSVTGGGNQQSAKPRPGAGAGQGPGDAGGWPSTTPKPSGKKRSNGEPK